MFLIGTTKINIIQLKSRVQIHLNKDLDVI